MCFENFLCGCRCKLFRYVVCQFSFTVTRIFLNWRFASAFTRKFFIMLVKKCLNCVIANQSNTGQCNQLCNVSQYRGKALYLFEIWSCSKNNAVRYPDRSIVRRIIKSGNTFDFLWNLENNYSFTITFCDFFCICSFIRFFCGEDPQLYAIWIYAFRNRLIAPWGWAPHVPLWRSKTQLLCYYKFIFKSIVFPLFMGCAWM